MAIRVEHKSTVIVTMIIWSRPWSAVVAPTSGKCSRMKGIYRRTVWCREGHVRASDHRIARADPEDRLLVRAVSRKSLPLGVKPLNAKRLQGVIVKLPRAGQIADSDCDVVRAWLAPGKADPSCVFSRYSSFGRQPDKHAAFNLIDGDDIELAWTFEMSA
jgi:hypothetical protein